VKLCALTQSYAPTGGGVRTMLHAQRDWVRARPHLQHVLIVPGARDSVERDANLTTYTVASPLVPGSSAYRLLLRSDKVLRILRAELPDVVEVHCAYNLPWTALLHRRRYGGVVSGVCMTDLPVSYVEAPLKRRLGATVARAGRGVAERYVGALYSRCDVAIAISPVMRQRLRALGVSAAHCVPLGVDLATFNAGRRDPELRARLGVRAGELLLVYAGRLDAEKRPDIVLDAFMRLPPACRACLVLVGDGPLRRRLEEEAAAAQHAGHGADAHEGQHRRRVHVLPFEHDRTRLARLLASADLYVSAMAHETFGLSVVEAQACGLPVVGMRAGAMVDRVRDAATGDTAGDGFLVDPQPPAALAAALAERIARTPRGEWRVMGRRARARAEAEFSWDRTFEKLHEIYRAAAGLAAERA
jgi:alpha-1,6-mannosyltransferase